MSERMELEKVVTEFPIKKPSVNKVQLRTPTQVGTGTLVPRTTKDTKTRSSASASNQDSSVILESQTLSKLGNGYTRLPNSILMQIVSGNLVRSEIQVLLAIARFTISFQRRHAPLSKSVLERQTGLRGPAVLQAISDLIAKGIVEKIPGDQYKPNLLGLKFTDDWDFFPKSDDDKDLTLVATETQVPEPTVVPAPTQVAPGDNPLVAVPTPAGVAPAIQYKEIKTIKNNIALSQLPRGIGEYFDQLLPTKKRESEWKAFEGLKCDFSDEDISLALQHIRKKGLPGGEQSHSPMKYLSMAIGNVIAEARSESEQRQRALERESRERSTATIAALEDKKIEQEWKLREQRFQRYFEERSEVEVIAEICKKHNFAILKGACARSFAINKWAEEHGQFSKQSVTK